MRLASYWRRRQDQAIAKALEATSDALRAAYLDLADHYRNMIDLNDRSSAAN